MNCVTDGQPDSAETPITNCRAAVASPPRLAPEVDGVPRARSRLRIVHEHREELQPPVGLDRPAGVVPDEHADAGPEREADVADDGDAVAVEDVEDLVRRPAAALPGGSGAKAEDALRKLLAAVGVVEE